MTANADRMYNLLPAVYRMRDADQGYPLRALLQIISEQVNIVDADIAQLYENWFIETCQPWVVPYIGALIGYTPVQNAAQSGNVSTGRDVSLEGILISRREVANTIRSRRHKGAIRLLEDLAAGVAGWPARAVEFYRLLGVTQNINFVHLDRGRWLNIRDGGALDRLGGAFDSCGRTVDVRRPNSNRAPGRYDISSVGVFVWRLQSYSITQAPAYWYEEEAAHCYLFSALGNDTALYVNAQPASGRPGELNVPTPILRRDIEPVQRQRKVAPSNTGLGRYYGSGKSFQIWVGSLDHPVPEDQIVAADLSAWAYRPDQPGQVAVDPELGRIALASSFTRKHAVWVTYNYGFSAPIGGGEYGRPISQAPGSRMYLVGAAESYTRIADALAQWRGDKPERAVIEITDSGVYPEQIYIELNANQTLQLRATDGRRPVLRPAEDIAISGDVGAWFILDGIVVSGRGIQVGGSMAGVMIRHCTLVPGWGLHCNCDPKRPTDASIDLENSPDCLVIEDSIVGAIQVTRDEVKLDPCEIRISDSILDATGEDHIALGASERLCAFANLTIRRSTVFGRIQAHAIPLAENCILLGSALACRRQNGCTRFCYVTPGSKTPRRYECQPDLVVAAVQARFQKGEITAAGRDFLIAQEKERVKPEFNSVRFGAPTYCQLSSGCAVEIKTGADDESEMGAFHDLYQPQRKANLETRLNEFTPAGTDVGIIYAI